MVSQGETFRVIATITDIDGNIILPGVITSHEVNVNNPSGTTVYTNPPPAIIHSGSGVYYTDFTMGGAQPLGGWRVIWTVDVGGVIGIAKLPFFVDDP